MSGPKPASPRIPAILDDPARNRGLAFTAAEREALGLTGRLPPGVLTLGDQAQREHERLRSLPGNLARNVYLGQLQDRNETLYFRLLTDHLAELLPVLSDPDAAGGVEQFGADHRRPRAIYLSIDRPDDIEKSFATLGLGPGDVDVIACSDAGNLPGIGDGGVGGARAAAGVLAVYAAAGGVRPDRMIGVSLDAGTDNPLLLRDPLYPGNRHPRRRGPQYEAFIARYVRSAARLFPGALLHFQDFAATQARAILHAYRGDRVFDGNLQGTGAVVLAAVYAASRVTGIPVKHQAVVICGTDAASAALADLLREAIVADGASAEQARRQIWLAGPDPAALARAIDQAAPTVLLGSCAGGTAFTRPVIAAMCAATRRPLILPLSRPQARAEARPSDVIAWSRGQALLATAQPAAPVEHDGTWFSIGHLDGTLAVPGIGLGVIVSAAATVTPRMLQAAAAAVAEQADASRPGAPLLPGLADPRASAAQVAAAVVRAAVADKVAAFNPTGLRRAISAAMWVPRYPELG